MRPCRQTSFPERSQLRLESRGGKDCRGCRHGRFIEEGITAAEVFGVAAELGGHRQQRSPTAFATPRARPLSLVPADFWLVTGG